MGLPRPTLPSLPTNVETNKIVEGANHPRTSNVLAMSETRLLLVDAWLAVRFPTDTYSTSLAAFQCIRVIGVVISECFQLRGFM